MTTAERPSEEDFEADVEALARWIESETDEPMWSAMVLAKQFVGGSWLAAHDAQVSADRDAEWVEARDRLAEAWASVPKPASGWDSGLSATEAGTRLGVWSIEQRRAAELRALAPTPREEGR